MASGLFQFKTDFKDPNTTVIYTNTDLTTVKFPDYYGGQYADTPAYAGAVDDTVNTYVEYTIESDGQPTLVFKLNSLGGVVNALPNSPLNYLLSQNITAFEATFLTPLGITRTTVAGRPTATDTLYITYDFHNDEASVEPDTFYVKIKYINTANRLVNVARVFRAIFNNKRDNNFVAGMTMLSMLRDDANHMHLAQTSPVSMSFVSYANSPMGTNIGPVGPYSSTDDSPHVRFTWPQDIIDPTGGVTARAAALTWFKALVRDRILTVSGVDIDSLSWIRLEAFNEGTAPQAYLGITFNIENDPVKTSTAVGIMDILKSGVMDYMNLLRGVAKVVGLPLDVNMQRGVFAHLTDSEAARDTAPLWPDTATNATPGGVQYGLWLNTGW